MLQGLRQGARYKKGEIFLSWMIAEKTRGNNRQCERQYYVVGPILDFGMGLAHNLNDFFRKYDSEAKIADLSRDEFGERNNSDLADFRKREGECKFVRGRNLMDVISLGICEKDCVAVEFSDKVRGNHNELSSMFGILIHAYGQSSANNYGMAR